MGFDTGLLSMEHGLGDLGESLLSIDHGLGDLGESLLSMEHGLGNLWESLSGDQREGDRIPLDLGGVTLHGETIGDGDLLERELVDSCMGLPHLRFELELLQLLHEQELLLLLLLLLQLLLVG